MQPDPIDLVAAIRCLVITPTFNEQENISRFVSKTLSVNNRLELLIIDDNSPDGTGDIADALAAENKRIHVLHRPQKLGLGTAYIAGFRYAINNAYDVVVQMDADFSHDPEWIQYFLARIEDYDMVVGSRYAPGAKIVNWPRHRYLLSFAANLYTRVMTGMPLRDATGGFKCLRRPVLEALDLDRFSSEGYAFQIEVNYRCWRKGFRICELPIVFSDRQEGVTKMNWRIIAEAFRLVWRLRFQR